jgi:hypothetical protein
LGSQRILRVLLVRGTSVSIVNDRIVRDLPEGQVMRAEVSLVAQKSTGSCRDTSSGLEIRLEY